MNAPESIVTLALLAAFYALLIWYGLKFAGWLSRLGERQIDKLRRKP